MYMDVVVYVHGYIGFEISKSHQICVDVKIVFHVSLILATCNPQPKTLLFIVNFQGFSISIHYIKQE